MSSYTRIYFLASMLLLLCVNFLYAQKATDKIYARNGHILSGTIQEVDYKGIKLAGNQLLEIEDFLVGFTSKGDILARSNDDQPLRVMKNDTANFHKIITIDQKVYAVEDIEIFNNKVRFMDYHSKQYFILDQENVAVILYENGAHKLMASTQTVSQCLNDISDLNTYARLLPKDSIELTPDEQEYFSERAQYKIQGLESCFRVLTKKSVGEVNKYKEVKQALKFFYDENRIVQVSSVNQPDDITTFKINNYLYHLMTFSYSRVDIEWAQIVYVNSLRRADDGKYYGTISIEQVFRGYNSDDVPVYQDVTYKDIEIVVDRIEREIDGQTVQQWEVFLSDISVTNTAKL